ncbi:MAG: methionyl-tRNA formyltransferase [Solirubrobacteraceae bacterium]|jgi:methionyl-tRNA formyltransferase|nr:methionyl-tRNA formyltransferase [Solirubrobacteraceae bacterium]
MRTVFLGTSDFAAAVLERLAGTPHRPALVVTRPDRPRGRGRKLAAPPVAAQARALGLELDQPDDVNSDEARARIAAAAPEAVCVCAFGALVREPLLSAYPMLNVHPSLLPRWRGAAPVERAIMAGDGETGVSIMQLVAELDAGPVAARSAEPIRPDDTYGTLARRLQDLGGDLLVAALGGFPPEFVPQPEAGATYAEKIGPQDRRLDPARPAAELERTVRALHPHIGAQVELPGGQPLRIHEAAPAEETDVPAGLVQRDGHLLLGAADGALELRVVQPPGGKPMAAGDFLRGRGLG